MTIFTGIFGTTIVVLLYLEFAKTSSDGPLLNSRTIVERVYSGRHSPLIVTLRL